jgi:hypothetical protein
MKKTVCDLCGHEVTPRGMTDGSKSLWDNWKHSPGQVDQPCRVQIELSVTALGSVTKDRTLVDLCYKCLRGLLANIGKIYATGREDLESDNT